LEKARQSGEDVEDAFKGKWDVPSGLLCVFLGLAMIDGMLFALGFWLYGNTTAGILATGTALIAAFLLLKSWKRLKTV
jgi:SSS family solute:Na+ symporter